MICATDFEAALDENPQDWTTRLVYADWLTEHGMDREAYCQRWLVAHQRHCTPSWSMNWKSEQGFHWANQDRWAACDNGEEIPKEIFRWLSAELSSGDSITNPYASRKAAEDDLAQALQLAKHSPRKP